MSITEKSIKLLWANAAGRCSFTGCNEKLTRIETRERTPYVIGEMAHIKGENTGSNRYDSTQSNSDRDDYSNLILLCPTHHTLIDRPENVSLFSVKVLQEMKNKHENEVLRSLEKEDRTDFENIKNSIAVLLASNKQCWQKYGPKSELAQKYPQSQEIYGIWETERLSTIVPNNRKIENLLTSNREKFRKTDQETISKFLLHVQSYERWVRDEIPYAAVERFPSDFEILILKE